VRWSLSETNGGAYSKGVSTEFSHDPDASRYSLRVDGDLVAAVDYVDTPTAVSFNHTFTSPSHRGQGFAGHIVEFAVNDVESSGTKRIVPMCWYVAKWFDSHPERAGLLSR
jgi:predicted GNAT family acetyltransferase